MTTAPMPTVTYEGKVYKLRSRKTEVPDLDTMDSLGARVWLLQNTRASGTNHRPPQPNLAGLAIRRGAR
jgi:hypothetical protein